MKISYLLGFILLAAITAILISTMATSSTYADFDEAFAHSGREYTVIGQLSKEDEIVYNPEKNPNEVIFHMMDKSGNKRTVILNSSKPQDMERSEDIVIKGKADKDVFLAHTILLKCPSKYEERSVITSTEK